MSSPGPLHHFNEFFVLIYSIEAGLLPHALSVLDELSISDLCRLEEGFQYRIYLFSSRAASGPETSGCCGAVLVRLVGAVFVFFTAYVSPLFLHTN